MQPLGKIIKRGILPLMALAIITISACTGLSGEPEIVSTLVPRATAQPIGDVPQNVDIILGEKVFIQNCTRCHGAGGQGDGEFAGQMPVPLIDFTDPQAVSGKTPQEWYSIIYNGKLENGMPPWGIPSTISDRVPLTSDEIWGVTMYLFTLSGESVEPVTTPDADVTAEATPSVTDIESVATPDAEATAEATLEVASIEPVTTPDGEATEAPESTPFVESAGMVSGSVVNGTAGASVPPDLPVKLYSSDATADTVVAETTLNPDGTFQFEGVVMSHGQEFFVTVAYAGGFFVSETLTPDSGSNTLELPVTIYDTTYDVQAIRVTNILTYASVLDGTLEIVQVIEFANITDKLYVQVVDEVVSALIVGLPEGAIFSDMTGGRFRVSEDGRTITDSRPVFPASAQESAHTLHFSYTLPYDGDVTIEQTFPYLVEGELDVLIQQEGLSVDGAGFQSRGSRMIAEGVFSDFGATLSLMPQTPIVFKVLGTVVETIPTDTTGSPNLPLAIVLVGAGVFSIGIAAFIFIKDKRDSAKPVTDAKEQINALMKQIAELDIQHKEGTLADGDYTTRRDKLKARLTKLMKDHKS
ncbi:MAG: c-type cytochrome [bacterium]|nr:c-type cytochrome [bacterium]